MKIKKHGMLLATCAITLLSLTACNKESNQVDLTSPTEVSSGYTPSYSKELQDVNEALEASNTFVDTLPEEYTINATADLQKESDADRVDYRIAIQKPKVALKNLTMSFSLNPQMTQRLQTSDVFTSNTINEEPVNYSPEDDTNSIILSRAFVLDEEKIDSTMSSVYEEMYVKISYTDESGDKKTNYIKMNASPSESLRNYIEKKTES